MHKPSLMKVPIDVPVIVNIAGGKGGVGTSTLTANMAYALGSAGAAYGTIGVVDTAYGANSTLSKLLGIPPLATNGFWNYVFSKYCDQDCQLPHGTASITPQAREHIWVVTSGTYESFMIDWGLSYILSKFGNDPNRVSWELYDTIVEILLSGLMPRGVNLVLVDIPGSVFKPLIWAFLMLARIVNVVVKAGSTHQDEALEMLNFVRDVLNWRVSRNYGSFDVILVVNHALPGDNTANELKSRGVPMLETRVLPYSPAVQVITDVLKDIAVLYDVPEDKYFRKWKEEVLNLARNEYELAKARKAPGKPGFFRKFP